MTCLCIRETWKNNFFMNSLSIYLKFFNQVCYRTILDPNFFCENCKILIFTKKGILCIIYSTPILFMNYFINRAGCESKRVISTRMSFTAVDFYA